MNRHFHVYTQTQVALHLQRKGEAGMHSSFEMPWEVVFIALCMVLTAECVCLCRTCGRRLTATAASGSACAHRTAPHARWRKTVTQPALCASLAFSASPTARRCASGQAARRAACRRPRAGAWAAANPMRFAPAQVSISLLPSLSALSSLLQVPYFLNSCCRHLLMCTLLSSQLGLIGAYRVLCTRDGLRMMFAAVHAGEEREGETLCTVESTQDAPVVVTCEEGYMLEVRSFPTS